ncbi:MAG: hypothetical protein HY755_01825 [Nitrospirae bacterium]|nr:hypothetical protein [Nitrospirota bacterium]
MINEIFLRNDYRFLIERITKNTNPNNNYSLIDAIFIPFRKQHVNVNELLQILSFYKGPIYLMPSEEKDLKYISWNSSLKVLSILLKDTNFLSFFNSLLTTNNVFYNNTSWDLPLKRNYALYFSRKNGYSKILLIDDDIRGVNLNILKMGSQSLNDYLLSGCFIEDFPDISIIDHLDVVAGEKIVSSLSGSFLFIKPFSSYSFFPNIYNEDLLFMLPHIIDRSICSFGSIQQLPYDPFQDPSKASFQEFGDIIAEGLFALLSSNLYEHRFNKKAWEHILNERKKILLNLRDTLKDIKVQKIIDSAMIVNKTITTEACLNFLDNMERDRQTWNSFLKESS